MSATDETRFDFGANWRRFLEVVDEERIETAQQALSEMLGLERLDGASFLDAGSGSGLSSLAAARLGADRIHSFDYDPESVACTAELRRRYLPDHPDWTVERGDVTDPGYVASLGAFDVVYSWGVLHHTGAMWSGMERVCDAVAPGGRLYVALYNDQGVFSRGWKGVKWLWNRAPLARPLLTVVFGAWFEVRTLGGALLRGRPGDWVRAWREPDRRGMSRRHDLVDWLGGYPFEVATPDEIEAFCSARGFELANARLVGRKLGCNELVFRRSA